MSVFKRGEKSLPGLSALLTTKPRSFDFFKIFVSSVHSHPTHKHKRFKSHRPIILFTVSIDCIANGWSEARGSSRSRLYRCICKF